MKLTCDRAALTDALSVCNHAVASKSPIPALEGIRLSVNRKRMTLCAFDLQMSIEKIIEVDNDKPEDMILPAKVFSDIIRKVQGDEIYIETDKDLNVIIRCGRSEFNLKAEPGAGFPEVPYIGHNDGVYLPCSSLRQMITDTMFAISTNENKPVHMGALFEVADNLLTVVSVDGYRLAIRKDDLYNPDNTKFSFVIPGTTLKELIHILPDDDQPVWIYPQAKHSMLEFNEIKLTTRLLDGDFINYRAAIPSDMPISMKINKDEVMAAVERVSLIISERLKNPIRCLFEQETLKLSCFTALGKSFDEVEIPFCPQTIEIGFNNRYLLDALRACPGEEVILELKSSLSPALFKPLEGDSFLYLVLPVRLKAEDL